METFNLGDTVYLKTSTSGQGMIIMKIRKNLMRKIVAICEWTDDAGKQRKQKFNVLQLTKTPSPTYIIERF